MIKAIIFDLNGIFIQSEKLSDRLKKDFNVDASLFLPKLSEIMHKVRKPNAEPAFIYWKDALEEWKVKFTENEFWEYWFGAEIQSDEMVDFAKNLKQKGIKIFILSNNFKERSNYYNHYPWIHEAIDKVYFSWQTGFIKPDPMAWKNVLNENNLKPEDCIYFDDQQKNLDSAKSLGIKSYMFTNEHNLKETINQLFLNILDVAPNSQQA
jgi:HAD superfamily hydrolase (TIGR01509 family)